MNERIANLAKLAGGHASISKFRGHFLPPPPNYIDPATVDLEKFAELLVKETLNQVNETMELTWPVMQVKIKQHFGVLND